VLGLLASEVAEGRVPAMKWKWANVPIPPQHFVGLVLGVILQLALKWRLFGVPWPGIAIGVPLIVLGVGLSAWAVLEAGETKTETPTKLFTHGPYALSRNPMYVAWTLLYLGIALTANAVWIAVLLPVVAAYTHLADVLKEERILQERFGDEYLQYKGRVRRYL
jgi:protein-S-isoprenylcysteine O-methyltransferase Ste14